MRELTKEELALRPSWATHYVVVSDILVKFYDGYKSKTMINGVLSKGCMKSPIPSDSKPIPRKTFDISEHEFVDKYVKSARLVDSGDYLRINISNEAFNTVIHNKQDAIAIAKALGVTSVDL